MLKIKEVLEDLWNNFGGIVLAAVAVLVVAGLLLVGYSFLATILLCIAIPLSVIFGSRAILTSSFIVAVLLKVLAEPLKQLSNLWLTGPTHDQFYVFLNGTGYISMILLVFLLMYIINWFINHLRSILGSISLVRHKNYVTINGEVEEDE